MTPLFSSPELTAILALHPELNEKFDQLVRANAPTEKFYVLLEELAAR